MDTIKDENIEVPENEWLKKEEIQLVKSMYIAEQLCTRYSYFRDLIGVCKHKRTETRRVWFFKRSEEFDKDFAYLVEEAKKRHENKENENG